MAGKNATIAKTAVIMDNVVIGDDVVIHDYVVIYPDTIIKSGAEIFDHCVIGKLPKAPGCSSREINTDLGTTVIGENSILSPSCVVYRSVQIGRNTLLGDFCSIREECSVGEYCLLGRNVTVNYNTTIGDRTKVMDGSYVTGNMSVGSDVFISALVATTNDNSMGRSEDCLEHLVGPTIEDEVSIGAGATLLPGVRIGRGSIVGAGAVVTKDVSERTVVMGVPAKFIRSL